MNFLSLCSLWTANFSHLLRWSSSLVGAAQTFAHAKSLVRWPGGGALKADCGDEVCDLDCHSKTPDDEEDGEESRSGETGDLHVVSELPVAPSQGRPGNDGAENYWQDANTKE